MSVCARVCVCVWERETGSHHSEVSCPNRSLCANTYKHHHCVCHVTLFLFGAWTDGKTKSIINCIYIYLKKWSLLIMVRGITFPTSACGVPPITMHCVIWPIRADCACRKEGLCIKMTCLREAGHRVPTIMHSIWRIICFFNIKSR